MYCYVYIISWYTMEQFHRIRNSLGSELLCATVYFYPGVICSLKNISYIICHINLFVFLSEIRGGRLRGECGVGEGSS